MGFQRVLKRVTVTDLENAAFPLGSGLECLDLVIKHLENGRTEADKQALQNARYVREKIVIVQNQFLALHPERRK